MSRTPDYSDELCLPRALLLDFGGVVVETENNVDWQCVFARELVAQMHADGLDLLDVPAVERDLRAGAKADSRWKDAMSRPFAPAELRYDQFWGDFVAADWPDAANRWVRERARELCRQMGETKQSRRTRVGMVDLLDAADAADVPVGIVSNTLMGVVHRDYLDAHGLTDRFAAQIYSDEVGVRKPNPRMIELGSQAVGVPVADCWYVGDNFDRDALCGARAHVGGNIIMEARDTYEQPYDLAVRPHAIVADPLELRDLFLDALGTAVPAQTQSTPV